MANNVNLTMRILFDYFLNIIFVSFESRLKWLIVKINFPILNHMTRFRKVCSLNSNINFFCFLISKNSNLSLEIFIFCRFFNVIIFKLQISMFGLYLVKSFHLIFVNLICWRIFINVVIMIRQNSNGNTSTILIVFGLIFIF
jgi:hypothetical protein